MHGVIVLRFPGRCPLNKCCAGSGAGTGKVSALGLLAAGLLYVAPAGRRPFPILRMVRVTAVFYLMILLFHLVGLAFTG